MTLGFLRDRLPVLRYYYDDVVHHPDPRVCPA